ncbi:hypothetical protein JJQ59_27780 [Cupriavidus necator]|uniref:Uncharacterized protein n=1 Tax=Cupriavidus necator TaxID=106590 RepID=A0A367PQ15_CUPNE|nr:hypothetical protein [Cupriavidus necator]QQX86577.1 hypothetical protein JJQ59_27780 [Cupriavidus necator]RCJ10011.1 hypothetical protein DDK22_02040 [Cupriavidus necator]
MAQDTKDNAGFSLPAPQAPATETVAMTTEKAESFTSVTTTIGADTSSRDLLIGGAVLLVLFVAFFFAKNAYANTLVGKRVPPNKANAAGWWLFIFLASLSTGVVLAAINSARFLAPLIIGPIAFVALVTLALTFVSGRK